MDAKNKEFLMNFSPKFQWFFSSKNSNFSNFISFFHLIFIAALKITNNLWILEFFFVLLLNLLQIFLYFYLHFQHYFGWRKIWRVISWFWRKFLNFYFLFTFIKNIPQIRKQSTICFLGKRTVHGMGGVCGGGEGLIKLDVGR